MAGEAMPPSTCLTGPAASGVFGLCARNRFFHSAADPPFVKESLRDGLKDSCLKPGEYDEWYLVLHCICLFRTRLSSCAARFAGVSWLTYGDSQAHEYSSSA